MITIYNLTFQSQNSNGFFTSGQKNDLSGFDLLINFCEICACLTKNDENNVVKYIDMLNKLAGDYKNININENDVKPLSTMSNEDLNKLIASIEN